VLVAIAAAFALAGVPDDGASIVRFVIVALLVAALGVLVAAVFAVVGEVRCTRAGFVEQGFGVCVGSDGPKARAATPKDPGALTDWLAARIDEVAGLDRPLLVSDLAAKGVNLQVMTTNLTDGRPMSFPFTDASFLFEPEELGRYFPPPVINALLDGQQ